MKNKLIFTITLILALSVKAQIYTPGGAIQGISVNNNIGIGTQTPLAKLSIQAGPNNYPTPLKAISIWGPNSPANSNSAQDLSWDFASAGSASIRSYRGANWDTYLQFLTNSNVGGNAPQVRMHISENGNVGIGSVSPNAPLDLVSNSYAQGIIVRKRVAGDYGNISFYDNAGVTACGGVGVAHDRIRIMSGGLGDLFERFSISSSGLVGVNSLYPLNTFEVKVSTSKGISSSDGVSIHDGAVYRLGINIGVNTEGEYSYLQSVKGGIGQKNIIFNPIGGNVGIGTITPDSKLAVNGTLHSKEVKVDMTGWSDFVFKKDYTLPTLEEVEKHIIEKGHLENIPTEDEVLKNGINLGEMNATLLQKIEELTLYAIEQEKKINTQSRTIETLKKENESFKKLSERLSLIERELKTKNN